MESRQTADSCAGFKRQGEVEDLLLGVAFSLHAPPKVPLDVESGWHRNRDEGHLSPVAASSKLACACNVASWWVGLVNVSAGLTAETRDSTPGSGP